MPSPSTRRRLLQGFGLALPLALLGALPFRRGALADAVPADLSETDRADISRIETYLNGITTMQARFQQFSAKSGLATGNIYLERPGFIRIEYDPPSPLLIIADSVSLHYYDPELDQINRVPLDASPIWFLLRDDVELGGDVTVTSFTRGAGVFAIGIAETDSPEAGRVLLEIADQPMELRQWIAEDGENEAVRVSLYDQRFGIAIDHNLFRVPKAANNRAN